MRSNSHDIDATAFAMFATVVYLPEETLLRNTPTVTMLSSATVMYIYQPVKSKKWDKNKETTGYLARTKKWEAEVEYANGTGIDLIAKSTMAILY